LRAWCWLVRPPAPTRRHRPKGPVVKPLLTLDLAPEMDAVQGRAMRMQLTIYEPSSSS
jgi:hypothetical protein